MRIRLPRRDKNKVRAYKQTVVNAVILVVVLAMLLYVAVQLSQNFSAQVSTQRTQMVTDVTYSYYDGCIFKDGEVLYADGDIVHYLVPDGAKVAVGQAYAEVYSGTAIPKDQREAVEDRLNELSGRISMLESGLEGGKNTSDLGSINQDIADSYYAYIDSILSGDMAGAGSLGDKMLGAMIDYSAITLAEAAKNTLATLKSEREALLSEMGGTKTTLVSERSFTFYRNADGYEAAMNSSVIEGLDRDQLDSLMKGERASIGDSIGSAVYSAKWYIALPADDAGYERFRANVGKTYEIGFLGADGLSINMLLEAVIAEDLDGETETGEITEGEDEDESGEEEKNLDTARTYLLFSSRDLSRIAGLDRHQSVSITLSTKSGYRIPREAVQKQGEDIGVYILVGNMIEFRRITIIGEGDGYYIASTYERDLSDNLGSEIPYLNINDLIVTSGRDLYDGKLLD